MKNELKQRIKRAVVLIVASGLACVACGHSAAVCFWEHEAVLGVVELVLVVINSAILAESINNVRVYRKMIEMIGKCETEESL